MNALYKLCFVFALLFFEGILNVSAQNKTATITIQTQDADGTISTKTHTFNSTTDAIDWDKLLEDVSDFDRDIVMGITLDEHTQQDQQPWIGIHYDSPKEGVVQITHVMPNSPAAKAGLQRGDIIKKFNGVDVAGSADLKIALRQYRPGDTVTLTIERKGAVRQVPLVLGGKSDPLDLRIPSYRFERDSSYGLQNFRIYKDNKPMLGVTIEEGEEGARILSVRPGSPAEQSGLQPGDEVTAIDKTPVDDAESLVNEIQLRSAGDTIIVTINRRGREEVRTVILTDLDDLNRHIEKSVDRLRDLERRRGPFGTRRRTITIEKRIGLDPRPTPPDASALVLEQLDLYPNPASETLTVALRTAEKAPVLLVLTNAQGQEIARYEQTPSNGLVKHIFDTSLLTAGQYFLTIRQGDKSLNERIIIQD